MPFESARGDSLSFFPPFPPVEPSSEQEVSMKPVGISNACIVAKEGNYSFHSIAQEEFLKLLPGLPNAVRHEGARDHIKSLGAELPPPVPSLPDLQSGECHVGLRPARGTAARGTEVGGSAPYEYFLFGMV